MSCYTTCSLSALCPNYAPPNLLNSARISMMVCLKAARQLWVRGGVDGGTQVLSITQELLGEGELIADAFMDMVRCLNQLVLVGILVQAVEETKREASASGTEGLPTSSPWTAWRVR
eukprot:6212980-Pleurochrysis_carterae.AAC.4